MLATPPSDRQGPTVKSTISDNNRIGIAHYQSCSRIWDRGSKLALESFGNGARLPVFLPSPLSPDRALNRKTRRLSMPDRKFLQEKEVGIRAEHLTTQEWLREHFLSADRPLSALISILETFHELSRNSFGI